MSRARLTDIAAEIRCPACNASGALCSTCGGKRFVPYDGSVDFAETTETDADWRRVKRDQDRALNGAG